MERCLSTNLCFNKNQILRFEDISWVKLDSGLGIDTKISRVILIKFQPVQ